MHTRVHLSSSTPFLPFHSSGLMLHIHGFTWCSVFQYEQGVSSSRLRECGHRDVCTPTRMVTSSSMNQLVSSSGPPTIMQLDAVFVTSGLTKEQTEEIFLLTHEVQALHRKLALDFIQLSHMGVQAAGYKKATRGHPDRAMAYYTLIKSEGEGVSDEKLDEAIEHLREAACEAWLNTNSLLFSHALEYQNKMVELIMSSGEAIQALHERIRKVVTQVMEDVGKSTADGLGIVLCLVDMLPTILLQLVYNTATAGLIGCTPNVYAAQPKTRTASLDFSHAPPPGSNQDAMAVLHEEILKNACGTEEKAIQPTWLWTVASVGSISVKAVKNEGGDDPNSPCMSLSQPYVYLIPQHHAHLLLHLCAWLVFWCHIVHQSLPANPHLQIIVLKVQDQVPLLQAPALGQEVPQGAHQVLAA